MAELKKCPFCGGEARLIKNDDGCAVVSCLNGSCNGNACCYKYDSPEEAVEAWNNRKPVDDVLERLEELAEKAMNNSEKAAELGKAYEKHMILNGTKGTAFEKTIEIIKEGMMRCE